jgi:hypothetical protein
MLAPMVKDENGKTTHFNDLKAFAAKLDDAQAKELRQILREHNPTSKPPREKVDKPASPLDPDYDKWLDE